MLLFKNHIFYLTSQTASIKYDVTGFCLIFCCYRYQIKAFFFSFNFVEF